MSSQEPQAWQPPTQPQPPAPPPPSGLMRNPIVPAATLTGLGGLLIVLGSFLPWLTATAPFVGTISTNGVQGGDGIITLILGVVTILIGVTQLTATNMSGFLQRSSIVTGIITAIVAVVDYNSVQERIEEVKGQSELVVGTVGTGIWTLFVGAALAITGGLLTRKLPRS